MSCDKKTNIIPMSDLFSIMLAVFQVEQVGDQKVMGIKQPLDRLG